MYSLCILAMSSGVRLLPKSTLGVYMGVSLMVRNSSIPGTAKNTEDTKHTLKMAPTGTRFWYSHRSGHCTGDSRSVSMEISSSSWDSGLSFMSLCGSTPDNRVFLIADISALVLGSFSDFRTISVGRPRKKLVS